MKLPLIKRLDKQDLTGKDSIPTWMDGFMQVLNQFIEPVSRTLQNRLTLGDNFYGNLLTIGLSHAVDQDITPAIKTKPIGVLLLGANGNKTTGFSWTIKSNGQITLNLSFANTALTNIPCTFFVVGG